MQSDPTPWAINDDGAWCPACGDIIAPSFWRDWEQKAEDVSNCKQCGFPDFEDGHGYFTDD